MAYAHLMDVFENRPARLWQEEARERACARARGAGDGMERQGLGIVALDVRLGEHDNLRCASALQKMQPLHAPRNFMPENLQHLHEVPLPPGRNDARGEEAFAQGGQRL